MANTITETKNGKYLKKTDVNSYVHYQFDTNDSIVYLSDKIDGDGNGAAYAKDARLHDTLCALYTLASEGGKASINLATLTTKVDDHIANKNNPHNVNKRQIGLENVVNATMDNTPIEGSNNYVKSGGVYTAVKNVSDKADRAISIANGQSRAYVFADLAGLKSGTLSNNQPIQSGYKVGDSIYIIAPDVSDFWISGSASTGTTSTDNDIQTAKKGTTIVVKWGAAYVSLTAFESKRDLNDYITTGELNSTLKNIYDKKTIEDNYVPYKNAKDNVNLGNHTITVGEATVQAHKISTKIAGGNITLNGLAEVPIGNQSTTVDRKVEINATGITIDEAKTYKYPLGNSGTLATQEFVTSRGYQTVSGVKSVIGTAIGATTGDVTFSGSVDNGITTTLSNSGVTAGTYSALTVDAKGRATKG